MFYSVGAGVLVCLLSISATVRGQLEQCELCPCTRLTNQAASGPVELLLTRTRSSAVSLTVVDQDELYRVRLQARVQFQDFHLCSIGTAKATKGGFPSRYLPLQARLLATCANIVTSGPQFRRKPGSVGELQFLWKSPLQASECVALSACIQLSSGSSANKWVHRSIDICTSNTGNATQAPPTPAPVVTDTPTKQTPPTTPPTPVRTPSPPVETQPPTPPKATTKPPTPPSGGGGNLPKNVDFAAFPVAAGGGVASVANVPSQGVSFVFPGPLQTQGVSVTLAEDSSARSTVMFTSDSNYQISATSSSVPFKRCYMLVGAEPNYNAIFGVKGVESPGDFIGKMRQGGETRHQGYSNMVECSAGQGLTATSTTVFWRAPKETVCVQISVWLELEDGVLTRADAPFCRISYKTGTGQCEAGLPPGETCSRCTPTSDLYFIHTGPAPPCCNGLPLGPEQQCCGNTIQPGTLATGWLCCGNRTTFNPEESTCCRGNKQLGRASDVFCCGMKSFSPSAVLTRSREARCCGSEAFDPADKLCCGGNLRDTWPGILGTQMACCPWDGFPYNPSTHSCMLCRGSQQRVVQPRTVPLACCGTLPYNQTDKVCCNQQTEDLRTTPYQRSQCCGSQVFDLDTGMCCLGQVARAPTGQQVGPNWRCCGTQAFDPATHECLECSGFQRLVLINEVYSCCGNQPFSRLSSICCNGQVRPLDRTYPNLGAMPTFSCCGSRAFDPTTQTCCSLSQSSVVDRRGTNCCGTEAVYNSVLGEKCIMCRGGLPQVLSPTDSRICCGSDLYEPLSSACCINPLRVVPISAARPRTSAPRLFCCDGVTYDANVEKCCPNSMSIVQASSLC